MSHIFICAAVFDRYYICAMLLSTSGMHVPWFSPVGKTFNIIDAYSCNNLLMYYAHLGFHNQFASKCFCSTAGRIISMPGNIEQICV